MAKMGRKMYVLRLIISMLKLKDGAVLSLSDGVIQQLEKSDNRVGVIGKSCGSRNKC